MPTVLALRGVVCTCLGLGVLDLAVINVVLRPRLGESRGDEIATSIGESPSPASSAAERQPGEPTPPPDERPAPASAQVFFDSRSARLDETSQRRLRELVDRAGTAAGYVLEGHADHRGSEATNRDLSRQRAVAVASYLGDLGIPADRIRLGYAGETKASQADELWRDRRVDITTLATEVQP